MSTNVPNLKQIGGGHRKNGQKFVDLMWNDPAGAYFMAAMLDLRHLRPSGPTKFVFHRILRIRKHICRHKIRGSTIFLRESMIICSELFNMGRMGNFVTFKPHFDNVPEFPRLYTFSML